MNRFQSRFARSCSTSAVMLAALTVLAPACKKDQAQSETTSPAKSREEVEKAVAEAKQRAKVEGLIDLANKDLQAGRHVSAIQRAEQALAENPNDANAYAVIGAAKWRAGDYEASTAAFRKALEFDPDNYGASLGLARNLQTAGKHAEVIELQKQLLAKDESQVDPRLMLLWSYYATCDAEAAVPVLDEIFKRMPADDPQLPLIQAAAAFLRPLADKGPLCQVEGEQGTSDIVLDQQTGLKHTGAVVGGEFARAIVLESREESSIDAQLAEQLGLEPVGTYTPLGAEADVPLVIVPEIKFGDLSLKNVPARVEPLDAFAAIGERPGLLLGRQALNQLGTLTFDFPTATLTVAQASPAGASEGAIEAPLLLVSMRVAQAPAMPIRIDGSDHEFFVYLGGLYKSGVVVTKKHYLKSGARPGDVADPEDPTNGLKMVYIDSLTIGETTLPGVGGLVLVNDPPDQNLGAFLENTAFELGGYLNAALLATWKVTYALPEGKIYIAPETPKA